MPMPQPAQPHDPALRQDVVLILADVQAEVPGYWNLALDVHERPTRRFRDGSIWQRTPLEVGALRAFEERRDILADGNYRISLSGDPATIDFLEVMRAKLIVSEGQEPIEIVIVEEEEVIEREPEPGEEPTVLEHRLRYRRLGYVDAPLPDDMIVFDLSSDRGSDAEGRQIPVDIPGARVIGWQGQAGSTVE